MSEIAEFVKHGADGITPHIVDKLLHQLPLLKAEFSQIDDAAHPHLTNQLHFLADVVEDFAESAVKDIPYTTLAHAAFAIIYARRVVDLIPDTLPNVGHSDDSSVARAVLIIYEKQFRDYAEKRQLNWADITSQA